MSFNSIALYPGSFDPFTYGHMDILKRATDIFQTVIVTIAVNNEKKTVFTGDERIELIKKCIANESWADRVEVTKFTGLLVSYARSKNAKTLIRGVRQLSDFEYEFRMALMNRRLAPEVDTVFLMPQEQLTFVSATLVKEVAFWGGDLSEFVPDLVANSLKDKMKQSN